MTKQLSNIHPAIIESLYQQALALAEEVRSAFGGDDISPPPAPPSIAGNSTEDIPALARFIVARQATHSTAVLMHILAWTLNQRAFLEGTLNKAELRRHCRLPQPVLSADDLEERALLPDSLRDLVERIHAFHARILRLDRQAKRPAPVPERVQHEPPVSVGALQAIS
ncbi:DUF1465 family protein [Altericroceibacterium spongiae]|uniref:DUF1465 family protein n=1 Tax=Altericroceibacterium spongiae TaxID=2320269 RepID=A0A420EK65_9SPHN|nr:DUF1465 family protein [Altericroceibacterium spongiae]RKF21040.1 DUF1465 family protein [Altericroceibacterium spongiae]